MRRRLQPDDGVVGHAGEGAGGGEVEQDARERPPAKAHGDLVRVRVRVSEQWVTTRTTACSYYFYYHSYFYGDLLQVDQVCVAPR